MSKPKVALLGYYGYDNAGDEWLCEQSQRVILKAWPSAAVRVVSRRSLMGVVRALVWADRWVLGGGSLFQDKSSRLSLLFYALICGVAMMMRRPVLVLANGIGPISTEMGRWVMRRLAVRFSVVVARDGASLKLFEQFGVPKNRLFLAADLAFFEKTHIEEHHHPAPPSLVQDGSRLRVGLNLRPTAYQSRLKAALARLPFSSRVGIAAHHGQDHGAIRAVFPGVPVTPLPLNIDMAKRMSGECDVLIAMRFHAIVWAVWHAIPCIAIADDDKTLNMAQSLGIPVIDLRSLQYESEAKAIFSGLLEPRSSVFKIQYDVSQWLEQTRQLPEVLRRYA